MKASWIHVENPHNRRGYSKFNAKHYHQILFDSSDAKTKQLKLFQKAIEKDHAVGKWMLRVSPEYLEETWDWIKKQTIVGELGCSAKLSPLKQHRHTICIHTFFDDVQDSIRIHNVLKERFHNQKLEYKPDIFGYLGIYGKRFNIPPSVQIEYFLNSAN